MTPPAVDAEAMLHERGLRVTRPRRVVIEILAHHAHASADDVYGAVVTTAPQVTLQSVYNVLSDLTTAGIARCIEPAGHPARYELRVGDNHHHVVCRQCGQISDVDCVKGHAPCLAPDTSHGFVIDEAEVMWWGLCPTCAPHPNQGESA